MELQENYQKMLEKRLETESVDLRKYYENKMEYMKAQTAEKINDYEREIASMKTTNDLKLKAMQTSQNETIDIIKDQYNVMLENMKATKVSDGTASIEVINAKIAELRDQLLETFNTRQQINDNNLMNNEKNSIDNKQQYQNMVQIFEAKKDQLMGIISNLELKLHATVQESNDQQLKIRHELNLFRNGRKYIEEESNKMREHFRREEERLKILKLNHLQEIQEQKNDLNKERELMLHFREKLDEERQIIMAKDPNFSSGRFEAEKIFETANQTMQNIKEEQEILTKQKLDLENLRHFLYDKEAALAQREDKLEDCREKSKDTMCKAIEMQNNANRQVKACEILKEQIFIENEKLEATKKQLKSDFEKLLNDRMAFQNIKERCWWCRLAKNGGASTSMDNNNTNLHGELGFGIYGEIGTIKPLTEYGITTGKPPPFNFNVKPTSSKKSVGIVPPPPSSPATSGPSGSHSSTDSDAVDNLLDKNVKSAMSRATKSTSQ